MNIEKIKKTLRHQKSSKSVITANYAVIEAPKLLLSIARSYKLKTEIKKGKNTDSLFLTISGMKHLIIKCFKIYNEKINSELLYSEKKLLKQLRAYKSNENHFNKYDFYYEADTKEYGNYDNVSYHITHIEDFLSCKVSSDMEYLPKRIKYENTPQKRRRSNILRIGASLILKEKIVNGIKLIPRINLSNAKIKLSKLSKELNLSKQDYIIACLLYSCKRSGFNTNQKLTAKAILRIKFKMPQKEIEALIESFI